MKKLFKRKPINNEVKEIKAPWTKFYGDVPGNLSYFQGTLAEMIESSASKYSDLIAYEYYGLTCTYREFYEKIEETAKALKAQGIKENDRVTICMPNTPQALFTFYAVNMVGAIANVIHPLSAEKEIEFYLNISECEFLLTIDIAYEKVVNIIENTKVEKNRCCISG